MKEVHPDVYKGTDDPNKLVQEVRQAYEELLDREATTGPNKRSINPFESPERDANVLFVNELMCLGRTCPSCCVNKVPRIFQFAEDTGAARAMERPQGEMEEDDTWMAVGQCPTQCIHYVTPRQGEILENELSRARNGEEDPNFIGLNVESLLAQAEYENNRYSGAMRGV